MKFNNIIEKNIKIGRIPVIVFSPKEYVNTYPTIIFYHGWTSNKEAQRFRGCIFTSLGYQVVIPDAIYHGHRNPLHNYNKESAVKYF